MQQDERHPTELERIEKEAADWMAFFDRGLTAEEQDAFFEWLAEDPRHGAVFAEDKAEWQALDLLEQWKPTHSKDANPDLLKKAFARPFWKQATFSFKIAALLMVSLGIVFILKLFLPHGSNKLAKGNVATTYERHTLEDGSLVELNTGAQVSVHFTQLERRVRLQSGEAHFSVAHNPAQPFVVEVQGSQVRALGTAFSVRLTSESLEVLVTEGKVSMEGRPGDQPPVQTIQPATPATELVAGQRAVQPLHEPAFKPEVFTVTTGEIESRLAWKDQILDFNSKPLAEVVAEFNRHNYKQILIGDPSLNDLRVTVALKPDNVTGFVRLLELSAGVIAEETENGTLILMKQ